MWIFYVCRASPSTMSVEGVTPSLEIWGDHGSLTSDSSVTLFVGHPPSNNGSNRLRHHCLTTSYLHIFHHCLTINIFYATISLQVSGFIYFCQLSEWVVRAVIISLFKMRKLSPKNVKLPSQGQIIGDWAGIRRKSLYRWMFMILLNKF